MDLDAQLRAPEQPLLSSNLRYMGFVNDVGEALHSFLPKPIYVRRPRSETLGSVPLNTLTAARDPTRHPFLPTHLCRWAPT